MSRTHSLAVAAATGLLLDAAPRALASPASPAAEGCPAPRTQLPDMVILCVDARSEARRVTMHPRGLSFVRPNRNILVQVLHPESLKPAIALGGEVGSWEAGSRSTFTFDRGASAVTPGGAGVTGDIAPEGEAEAEAVVSTESVFAPRRPGAVELRVSFVDDAASEIVQEFFVEETYSGVFRVGVAGIFGGAVERTYRTWLAPGSSQREISGGVRNAMDLDVVIGFAPYLDEGGRGASGCASRPLCLNPYFGVGTVGTDGQGGFEWLKSVHLGVEWELTPTFSVGLTGTVRRVDRLPAGLRPGAPLDGDLELRKAYGLGVALVMNVSPEFLKVGAEGAEAVIR